MATGRERGRKKCHMRAGARSAVQIREGVCRTGHQPRWADWAGPTAATQVHARLQARSQPRIACDHRTSRRARQIRANSRPSACRSAASSWRKTMPERPLGNRYAAGSGSGRRAVSVNSQSRGTLTGGPDLTLPVRTVRQPQAISLLSTALTRDMLGPTLFCPASFWLQRQFHDPTSHPCATALYFFR